METYNYMSIYTIILTSIWVFYTYLYLDVGVHTIIFIYIREYTYNYKSIYEIYLF